MRTDLIGGEDFLAKIESLTEQQQAAQDERASAEESLREARRSDISAEAQAVRSGAAKPTPTEPDAQKRLDAAARNLEVLTRAVTDERELWMADLHVRDDEIRQNLAAAEDAADDALTALIAEAEDRLAERDEIRAYREWLDDTSRKLSTRRVGNDPLAELRKAVKPGVLVNSLEERRAYEARVDAWNAFVSEIARQIPADQKVPVLDGYSDSGTSYPAIDEAIEREITRREEAGEEVPVPVTKKWMQRLGTTAKPKGKGTGWSQLNKAVPTVMSPDTDSVEARRGDLVKA